MQMVTVVQFSSSLILKVLFCERFDVEKRTSSDVLTVNPDQIVFLDKEYSDNPWIKNGTQDGGRIE